MNIINLLIMLALISLLVLVHEWGHYIAARAFGVKVSKFGFGMPIGPVLFRTKRGDLEILIHACLLGGYVSFPEDEEEEGGEPVLPPDSPERFKNQAPWKQAIIVTAGVIMNVLFAFLLIVLAATIFHKLPTGKSTVTIEGFSQNSYAEKNIPNTFKKGDKVISINGNLVDSTYKFIFYIKNSKLNDGKADKEVIEERLQEFLKLNPKIDKTKIIPAGTKITLPDKKVEPMLQVKESIASGMEKYVNNEIELSTDEIKLRDEMFKRHTYVLPKDSYALEIATAISDYYRPMDITLERDGKIIQIKGLKGNTDGVFGIKLEQQEIYTETTTPKSILTNSVKYMWKSTKLMCYGLYMLVTGKIPVSEMHGIVAITKIGTDIITQRGMLNGLLLTALISIDLALINILPIPALDGGHLMFITIEKIRRKPLDEKLVENLTKTFFGFLIALMILVVFNDIFALITKKF